MSDDLFWREMEARLDQDEEEDEVFHRALDDLEPVQRGGAAVDDEAGGAGPSRTVLILGSTPSSIDGVNAWASTNASSRLGCTTNGRESLLCPSPCHRPGQSGKSPQVAILPARVATPTEFSLGTPPESRGPSGTVWRRRAAPVCPGPARIHAGGGGRQ